ncbi:MAG: HAD family hydrolase, partial [Firmicutes bacterium]|nr:HAD family hydrolase [Bacillota bacterium]
HPYIREHGGRLYDGVKDMLENLKQEYFLAIVSNSQDGYVQAFLDYTGLWIYFGDMEMAGRTGKCKGENIRLVMERNHLEQAVYVGDTDGDQKAAALAEVPFVYAEYGFGQAENPEYSITEVWKLPELISKIL